MHLDLCLNYDKSVALRIGKDVIKFVVISRQWETLLNGLQRQNTSEFKFGVGKNFSVTLTNKKQNSIKLQIVFLCTALLGVVKIFIYTGWAKKVRTLTNNVDNSVKTQYFSFIFSDMVEEVIGHQITKFHVKMSTCSKAMSVLVDG
jgi:hypothetical protein